MRAPVWVPMIGFVEGFLAWLGSTWIPAFVGLLVIVWAGHIVRPKYLAAFGIHGLGEGAAFGATAFSTSSISLLDAFGGVSAGVAYLLHKGLEPMMSGACYCVYSDRTGSRISGRIRDVFFLSMVFVLPSLVGAPVGFFVMGPATGFFAGFGTTYFFALGTGTSIYAALRLSRPLFRSEELATSEDSIKIVVPIVLGFIAIYFAALFHS